MAHYTWTADLIAVAYWVSFAVGLGALVVIGALLEHMRPSRQVPEEPAYIPRHSARDWSRNG